VYTFQQRGDRLIEIGRVEGLGPTELIRSARFLGDYGYIVTFRQTDPLYSIDLRDPTKPQIAGELKVSGYSDYLHPIGRGRLLGIGQDADEETGIVQGSKAALFDVSKPAAPKQVGTTRVVEGPKSSDWEDSEAEHDWHAFLWWSTGGSTGGSTGKAILPVDGYGQAPDGHWYITSEVAVLKVRNKTLSRQATIRHPIGNGEDGWSSPIRRSLVINGELITVSRSGVKVNNLNTIKPLAWIPTK
jgi:Beta propeller domain